MTTTMFNFKARFVSKIEDGTKIGTIRAPRKRNAVAGDDLRLSHGSRFKPKLIGFAVALQVAPILIDLKGEVVEIRGAERVRFCTADVLDPFAVTDGFDDWADMRCFWLATHLALPVFDGFLTRWNSTFKPGPRQ